MSKNSATTVSLQTAIRRLRAAGFQEVIHNGHRIATPERKGKMSVFLNHRRTESFISAYREILWVFCDDNDRVDIFELDNILTTYAGS